MRALVPLLLSRRRPDALIAHMCPIYLVLAAPLAKIVRMPLGMWYTHWAIDWELRVATALADVALSVDRRSYPIDRPKVLGIGHGIDVAQFAARDAAPARERDAAPARARTHVAVEGLRHARAGVRPRPARRARAAGRDPRRFDDRRGAAASPRARGADRGGGPDRRR